MILAELRERIDQIDRDIVRLLNERALAALEVGVAKQNSGNAIRDRNREASVIKSILEENSGPLPNRDLERIFTEIMSSCRSLQESS